MTMVDLYEYLSYNQAEQKCRSEGGTLAVPNDENEYQFFRYMIMKNFGLSGKLLNLLVLQADSSTMNI